MSSSNQRSVNEPEGALQLALRMLDGEIKNGERMRERLRLSSELFGRTVALVELLDSAADTDDVILTSEGTGEMTSVADHVARCRDLLVSSREMDSELAEYLGKVRMLFDRCLAQHLVEDDGDDS